MGVDPGTLVTGYGVVARSSDRLLLLCFGTIRNKPESSLATRLQEIHARLTEVIGEFRPSAFVVESAFYGKNAQSALKLGHARGVALLSAAENEVPVTEYTPREIKKAVTGNGHASKHQVQYMVRSMLPMMNGAVPTDASDAIAAAVCHFHRLSTPSGTHKDWKEFIGRYPERVIG